MTEKCGKQLLSGSKNLKNSTTGCEEMAIPQESVQKSMKSDTFLTLSGNFCRKLTVSMGKSLPFREYLKYCFPGSVEKQSI